MRRVRFIGGPVDGGTIKLEKHFNAYYIPIRPEPRVDSYRAAPDDAVPTITKLLCYVYTRRGDYLIYVGEELR